MDTRVSTEIDNAMETTSKLVWDLPLRIFHWSLAVLFFTAWFTGEGDRWPDIHIFAGYAILGLILFRVLWGFLGTRFARFRNFSYSFSQGREYAIHGRQGTHANGAKLRELAKPYQQLNPMKMPVSGWERHAEGA